MKSNLPSFRDHFESWLTDALSLLAEKECPQTEGVQITFGLNTNRWTASYPSVPDYRALLLGHDEEIESIDATKNLIAVIHDDAALGGALFVKDDGSSVPPVDQTRWLYHQYLRTFAFEHLQRSHQFAIVPEVFDTLYRQFSQFIEDPGATDAVWETTFWNATSKRHPIELEPNVMLRQMTVAEQERAVIIEQFDRNWDTPEVVLDIRRNVDGRYQFPDEALQEWQRQAVQAVLLALRLIRADHIAIRGTRFRSDNPFARLVEHWSEPTPDPRRFERGRYVISPKVEVGLQRIWPNPLHAASKTDLRSPLERFARSYERRVESDRHVDYWIALEALYLPRNRQPKKREFAATTIAADLGSTESARSRIRKCLFQSYDLRSDTVHGDVELPPANASSLVRLTGDYLRQALLKRID